MRVIVSKDLSQHSKNINIMVCRIIYPIALPFSSAATKQFGKSVANLVLGINNETELMPPVNFSSKAVEVRCDNIALLLVCILGVLNNDVSKDENGNTSIITEISYMELGYKQICVYMIPGELSPEIESVNLFSAEGAENGRHCA